MGQTKEGRYKPYLALALGVSAVSTAAIMIRYAQAEGAPSLVVAAYRLSLATLILSAPALGRRVWREYAALSRKELAAIFVSGVLLSLHFGLWISSLAYPSVLSPVVLVTTSPIWAGLAAPLALGERNSLAVWLGVLAATTGSVIIGLADANAAEAVFAGVGATLGNIMALSGAVMFAGYAIIGRRLRGRLSLLAYIWAVYGVAAVGLALAAVAAGRPLLGYNLTVLLCTVGLALGPQIVGHSSFNYALRHLPAAFVTVTILLEPVGSTLLAIVFLHEKPRLLSALGGGLILVGVALASRSEHHSKTKGKGLS